MDPPSTQLVQRLTSLGLCTAGDLRRCRSQVRRLARDLPTFDSVWIDALVQNRMLTTFQATMLGASQPESLSVGPFVLADRLGSDGRFTHYRARRRDDRRTVLLTIIEQDPESAASAPDRLQAVLAGLRGCGDRGICPIQDFHVEGGRLVIAGPWVEGSSLQELLVRRGRFPVDVVFGILRQIAPSLLALEHRGAAHGDLRLRNIWLTSRGNVLLMRSGLLSALWPEVTIYSDLPADCYDTIAPERIGSGQPATARSDLYALGCVLWELLTGRPPWPHGDPLAKLSAHQTKRIPDVRTWSPDTPASLAELILRLTDPDPGKRPGSAESVTSMLRGTAWRSRRRLARFAAASGAPAGPHRPAEMEPPSRAGWIAAGSTALVLLSVCLVHAGARTELLHIAQSLTDRLHPETSEGETRPEGHSPALAGAGTQPSALQALPTPDVQGVLQLEGGRTYEATEIAAVGSLTIRCAAAEPAVILVRDRPLRIWGERVVLDNIALCSDPEGSKTTTVTAGDDALLVVDAQELAMRHCVYQRAAEGGKTAIRWSALDPESAAPQRLLVRDSLFLGPGNGLRIETAAASLELANVLQSGPGALLDLREDAVSSPRPLVMEMRQVTLRASDGLIQCALSGDPSDLRRLEIVLHDCVFDIAEPRGTLLQFDAATLPSDWPVQVRIGGEGSVLGPATNIAGHRESPDSAMVPLDVGQLVIEGLQFADFTFAGPDDLVPEDSLAVGEFGYRRSSGPPGIDPAALPRAVAGPYNFAGDPRAYRGSPVEPGVNDSGEGELPQASR